MPTVRRVQSEGDTAKRNMKIRHPQIVKKVYLDGHVIEHEILRSVYMFLIAYVLIFADGEDFQTSRKHVKNQHQL